MVPLNAAAPRMAAAAAGMVSCQAAAQGADCHLCLPFCLPVCLFACLSAYMLAHCLRRLPWTLCLQRQSTRRCSSTAT